MKTFLLFLSLINFSLDVKTLEETHYLTVKYSKHLDEISFSFSEWFCHPTSRIILKQVHHAENHDFIKNEILLPQKDRYLQGAHLIFILGIALVAIGAEYLVNKKSNTVKQHNVSLVLQHQGVVKRNHQLRDRIDAMQKKTEENKQLIHIMAHDLKSPVAAIVGLSSLMMNEHHLPPHDKEVIDLIHASGQDSLKFIDEILDHELVVAEQKQEVNLKDLLKYCVAQIQVKANEKQQHIILQGIEVSLRLDRTKMWRAFTNLLVNAIKFSLPSGQITITISQINQYVQIAIADQGIGIPDELKKSIFSHNDNRKRQGTAGEKSFGMGLSIAKQTVEEHGGLLTFESEVDKGTTFFIEFPIN